MAMKRFLILAIAVLLGACASAGSMQLKEESGTTVATKIFEGKTTRGEVQSMYGQPSQTTFTDAGNEIWTYRYAYATPKAMNFVPIVGIFAGGADVQSKELVVMFDKNNVVSRFTMRESQQEVVRGAGPRRE
jgi:outer membrane protein assembly factor BamE (lipoprotein component of BamABCDE complex)